jgi:hypothetical protein
MGNTQYCCSGEKDSVTTLEVENPNKIKKITTFKNTVEKVYF